MMMAGCTAIGNLFDSSDNTAEPAELVDFEPTIKVRTVWQRRVGSGAGKFFLKLRPAVDGDFVYAATRGGRVRAFNARDSVSNRNYYSAATISLFTLRGQYTRLFAHCTAIGIIGRMRNYPGRTLHPDHLAG